ncbi:MAG: hypothetical protein EAZ89_00015 [Bacteroidetes bacterium]|nr:MAG: hypothetical protein EAZ89_00015 [Bacteroidota bacterium]
MQKMLLFLFVACVFSPALRGQTAPVPSLRLHYYGYYLFHPGLTLAWEQPLATGVKQKEGKKPGEVWHTLFVAPQLGFYSHVQNHQGLFAGADLGYKATRKRGFEYQVFVTGNYLHTYLANPTFVQQSDGTFVQKKWAGRGSFMPGAGFGLGQNLYKTGKAPLSWSARLVFTQPRQATSTLSPNLSLGINYYLTPNLSLGINYYLTSLSR